MFYITINSNLHLNGIEYFTSHFLSGSENTGARAYTRRTMAAIIPEEFKAISLQFYCVGLLGPDEDETIFHQTKYIIHLHNNIRRLCVAVFVCVVKSLCVSV